MIEREPADLHAVLFGAGEIEQGGPEIVGRDDPQIDLQPRRRKHAGLGGALPEDALDLGKLHKLGGHLCAAGGVPVFQRADEIDITDGLAPTPQAAGDLGLLDELDALQSFEQRLGDFQRIHNPHAPRRLRQQRDALLNRFDSFSRRRP